MAQFVEIGGVHLVPKDFLIPLGLLPDICQEENDLRRQGQGRKLGIRVFGADEEPERVGFNAVAVMRGVDMASIKSRVQTGFLSIFSWFFYLRFGVA
jgi:hypothetical protein